MTSLRLRPPRPCRLIPLLGLVLLASACHRARAAQDADEAASGGSLKVEAYDAPIPKAPLTGAKLQTLAPRPQAPAPPAAASDPAPAASDLPPT